MGKMIYTGGKMKNQPKKPGWKEAAAQEAAWLASIKGMKGLDTNKYKGKKAPITSPVVGIVKRNTTDAVKVQSVPMGQGGGTKKVLRPEITYKDNEELLKRELIARERKFNTAPAYNKGAAQYVSEEELGNQLKGNKRRP